MNITAISDEMLGFHSTINKTECIVIMCDSKQILRVGEEINSNNKQRYKSFCKFVVLYGISSQPFVGTCHPAPTRSSILLLCTLLHRVHTDILQRATEEKKEARGGEKRC